MIPDLITLRLTSDLTEQLRILCKATMTDRSKMIRCILLDFFNKNEELIDEYYNQLNTMDNEV